MDYVSELLADYPPTMSARLLAYLLTANSGRPEEEYKCLKQYPQLTMRTHVRALAAIVDHATKSGDAQGAFALGVKLCNLRAAAKWGIEHYQRRIQGEGIDHVYRGVPLPGNADSLGTVMRQFEREQRRDDLERRHAHLAKVYPTLFGGDDGASAQAADAAYRAVTGEADGAPELGAHNLFRKEFGHLSEASQHRFKADSLWMGHAEDVLRGGEASRLRSQLKQGLSKGLHVKIAHRKPTFQEAMARQQKAGAKAAEEAEAFSKGRSKRAPLPGRGQSGSRGSDTGMLPAVTDGSVQKSKPGGQTAVARQRKQSAVEATESFAADEIDDHYCSGLEANTQGRHEEAVRHYTAALTLDKWRPEIWTSRGMAYYCTGDYEAAARDFTRCIRIEPKRTTPVFFRARCFHKAGDLKAALADFDTAVAVEPENVEYIVARAQLLLELREPKQALRAFLVARELAPLDAQVAVRCAQAYTSLKDFKSADGLCTAALSLLGYAETNDVSDANPTGSKPEPEPEPEPEVIPEPEPEPEPVDRARPRVTAETLTLRGNARWEMDQAALALIDYRAALAIDPTCAVAHHCIGAMLAAQGLNLDEAMRELKAAVDLQPDLLIAHFQLAAVHMQLEEHDMAAVCLTCCIENANDDPQKLSVAYCQRGVAHTRKDNPQLRSALADYTAALRYDPWLDSAWCCRGIAYGLLGRTQRAARDHARATELDYRHEACLLTRDTHCSRLNLARKALVDDGGTFLGR